MHEAEPAHLIEASDDVPSFREVLGALGHGKPSGVFRTNWAINEQMKLTEVVQLGVSVETEVSMTSCCTTP